MHASFPRLRMEKTGGMGKRKQDVPIVWGGIKKEIVAKVANVYSFRRSAVRLQHYLPAYRSTLLL